MVNTGPGSSAQLHPVCHYYLILASIEGWGRPGNSLWGYLNHFSVRLSKPTGLDHAVWWEILINWLNISDYCSRAVNNTSFIISVGKQGPANYQCPAPGCQQHCINLLLWNNKLSSHCPTRCVSCWCGSSCCHGSGTAPSPPQGVIPAWYTNNSLLCPAVYSQIVPGQDGLFRQSR